MIVLVLLLIQVFCCISGIVSWFPRRQKAKLVRRRKTSTKTFGSRDFSLERIEKSSCTLSLYINALKYQY